MIVEYCHHGNVHDYLVDQRHRFVDEVDPDTRRLNSASVSFTSAHPTIKLMSILQNRFFFSSPAGINGAADHEINEENDGMLLFISNSSIKNERNLGILRTRKEFDSG